MPFNSAATAMLLSGYLLTSVIQSMVTDIGQDSGRNGWAASQLHVNGTTETTDGRNLMTHPSYALPSNVRGFATRRSGNLESISGFIFLCNRQTKSQCYQYRVFGVPLGKLNVVEKIRPGTKLFLFDFDVKLLYGVYEATSCGTKNLEPAAFSGNFPAQVGFRIDRDCLPLHESYMKQIIQDNYQKGKFSQELSHTQVQGLLSAFRPFGTRSLSVPSTLAHKSTAEEGQSQRQQYRPPFRSREIAVSDAPFAVQNNIQPQQDYYGTAENGASVQFSNMQDSRFQYSHAPAVSDAQYSVQIDESHKYEYYRATEMQQGHTHQSVDQHAQPAPTLPYPYNPSDPTIQHGYVQPAIQTETIDPRVQQPQEASSQQHFYPSSLTQYNYPQGQQGYADSAAIQQPEAIVDPYYWNGGAVAETIPNYQQYNWSNHENYGFQQSQGNTVEQQYIPHTATTVPYTQPHQQYQP
ncbi:DCD domain-containing protein NRP [Linum grandiflorum]